MSFSTNIFLKRTFFKVRFHTCFNYNRIKVVLTNSNLHGIFNETYNFKIVVTSNVNIM